jgi:hypothetical protein
MNRNPEIEAQLRETAQRFTKEESAHTATIIQRDMLHDIADELAERIGLITGVNIGEHSSDNDPWMKAKYAADEYIQLLPQPAPPTAPQDGAPAAEVVDGWVRLTAPGQIRSGDDLKIKWRDTVIEARAAEVLRPGSDKEEVVYNRKKNHYFIVSMVLDGTESHKEVMFKPQYPRTLASQGAEGRQPLSEDTARLNWLETKVVNVREKLVYGSRDLFWSSPEQDDPSDLARPSDIRKRIDSALLSESTTGGKSHE